MSSYQSPSSYYLLNQVALSNSIRKLWVDYISWTTALIYTVLFGTHDQASIEERLDQTADEYAALFGQFYGPDAANKLRTQLMQFSRGIAGLAQAYRDDNISAVSDQRQTLYHLADEMSLLYSQLNRNWDMPTLQVSLYEMINNYEKSIVRIKAQDYTNSIEAHDALMDQAYKLSDELAYGILRQFQL